MKTLLRVLMNRNKPTFENISRLINSIENDLDRMEEISYNIQKNQIKLLNLIYQDDETKK